MTENMAEPKVIFQICKQPLIKNVSFRKNIVQ